KKKRRKGYKKKNGHRQSFSQIIVENIIASGTKKSAVKKDETTDKAQKVVEAVSEEVKVSKSKTSKKADDLKLIEGIGPKAAEVLVAAGLDTFEKLAKSSVSHLKEILDVSDAKVQHLDPGTWAQQAQLAADGNFDELKKLQDELNGGKAV
ncbi:MAG TPA: 50S ribosomal protein L21, partial [Flavobacterium sp.]|nr:50S ribosomal protein L21 [Flavobacterium sp.]